jgi:CubicO group peptidase (beta-lactamase class C family)
MKIRFFVFVLFSAVFVLTACKKNDPEPTPTPTPIPATYYYPPLTGNTWETISPTTLGWNTNKLNELIEYVRTNNSTAFIILYKGRIVSEHYWNGFTPTSSERIFSSTKSIGAFMIGLAQEQGKLNINEKVSTYLGTGWSSAPLFRENLITVKHLISMTSGLTDALAYEAQPGTKWYYNTPAYHKIYAVLAAAYNQTNDQYTREQLWNKIGMQQSFWDVEPGNGPSMSCSGRDMARFGLMMLADGKWNGVPVMNSNSYFTEMLSASQSLNPSYGYLWWLNGQSSFILPGTTGQSFPGNLMPNAPLDLKAALGFADKKIYVVKSRDLVVIRHGQASNAPITQALSNFDNEIWRRMMETIN